MSKRDYEKPVLRTHGQVESTTRGAIGGAETDAAFPVDTPFVDVTFS